MGHALVRMPCTLMHMLWFYPVSIGPPDVCTPFVPHAYWNSATSNFAILLPSSRPPPKERSLPLDATNRYKAHTHLVSGSSRLAATGASSPPLSSQPTTPAASFLPAMSDKLTRVAIVSDEKVGGLQLAWRQAARVMDSSDHVLLMQHSASPRNGAATLPDHTSCSC
jgi:hypothetical protein